MKIKYFLYLIVSAILLLLVVSVGWLIHNHYLLETEIQQFMTGKGNLSKTDTDYIIRQMDRDSVLILSVMGVLFVLATVIPFINFEKKIESIKEDVDLKLNEQNANLEKLEDVVSNIVGNNHFQITRNDSKELDDLFDSLDPTSFENLKEKIGDIIEKSLVLCEDYALSLTYKTKASEIFKRAVKELLKNYLKQAASIVKDYSEIETSGISYERFLDIEESILMQADSEDKKNLATIFSKLKFHAL